jgi:hypothetical protein
MYMGTANRSTQALNTKARAAKSVSCVCLCIGAGGPTVKGQTKTKRIAEPNNIATASCVFVTITSIIHHFNNRARGLQLQ